MTTTRTSTPPDARVDDIFQAFADRTRLRLLHLLQHQREICVCDLVRILDLPQAKVSRHLACLRAAGLTDTRREGPWVHYRLARPRGRFHKKILECLRCCLDEVPELQTDLARLTDDGSCC